MLRHVIELAETKSGRALQRHVVDRQRKFETRFVQSFAHMRERDRRVDA